MQGRRQIEKPGFLNEGDKKHQKHQFFGLLIDNFEINA